MAQLWSMKNHELALNGQKANIPAMLWVLAIFVLIHGANGIVPSRRIGSFISKQTSHKLCSGGDVVFHKCCVDGTNFGSLSILMDCLTLERCITVTL